MKKINKKKLTLTIIGIAVFVVMLSLAIRVPIIKQLLNLVFISFIISYILKPLYMLLISKGVNKNKVNKLIILKVILLFIDTSRSFSWRYDFEVTRLVPHELGTYPLLNNFTTPMMSI